MNLKYVTNDGIQTWYAAGHVDKAEFLAAVKEHETFKRLVAEFDWPEPTIEDVGYDLLCWDVDEPENVYYLPQMEADRQEAIKEGYPVTEPKPFTQFVREGKWHSRAAIAERA